MKISATKLEGVFIIEPDVFGDNRGFFMETYQKRRYMEHGIHCEFVQDNLSFSVKNTLRGLHFQITRPQAKLVQVLTGEIFDVIVDVRIGSSTYGQWTGVRLSDENHLQVYIPEGFAHGFCVMSDKVLFSYKCSDYYQPDDEGGILWSDPDIGIDWPVTNPMLSKKDMDFPVLSQIEHHRLPQVKIRK